MSELSNLTIETNRENTQVEKFMITLAYGSSPVVHRESIAANSFDLTSYANVAQPGDKIIIELLKVSGENNITDSNALIVIPFQNSL